MYAEWLILIVGVYAVIGICVFKIGFEYPNVTWLTERFGEMPVRILYIVIGLGLIGLMLLRII